MIFDEQNVTKQKIVIVFISGLYAVNECVPFIFSILLWDFVSQISYEKDFVMVLVIIV